MAFQDQLNWWCISKMEIPSTPTHIPRKLSRILAAFSASPGRLNPWTKSREPLATLVELAWTNAVACTPAFCAPLRNLSNIDMAIRYWLYEILGEFDE